MCCRGAATLRDCRRCSRLPIGRRAYRRAARLQVRTTNQHSSALSLY